MEAPPGEIRDWKEAENENFSKESPSPDLCQRSLLLLLRIFVHAIAFVEKGALETRKLRLSTQNSPAIADDDVCDRIRKS